MSALGYSGIISLYPYVFVSHYVFTVKMLPQVWRIFTAFLITKPKFGILMDPFFLYQYGSGLERESSRFTQPGDFFVYTVFVGGVIAVSTTCVLQLFSTSPSCRIDTLVCDPHNFDRVSTTSSICPPSLRLAVAVPETEEDHPCASRNPVIRTIQKGIVWCVSMVRVPLEAL